MPNAFAFSRGMSKSSARIPKRSSGPARRQFSMWGMLSLSTAIQIRTKEVIAGHSLDIRWRREVIVLLQGSRAELSSAPTQSMIDPVLTCSSFLALSLPSSKSWSNMASSEWGSGVSDGSNEGSKYLDRLTVWLTSQHLASFD